jgi:acetyltransferase
MGGIFTEVLKDRALGLPPMNRLLARRMMQQTRVWTLLQGYRNRPPADMERLEEMIIRLSQMLIDYPQIAELDMNPVMIKDGKSVAVDARILVSEPARPYPLHLVISPYPAEEESHLITKEGARLLIRPVRPEDAPLFQRFFKALSPETIYYRLFSHVKELNPQILARFTQIDYDREIALVALDEDTGNERMLGVARIMGDPDGRHGEFAVVVGDSSHGKGIGSNLLGKCLEIAEKRGFQKVYGFVLRDNESMLALGKKLGFQVKTHADTQELELVITLAALKGGPRASQQP